MMDRITRMGKTHIKRNRPLLFFLIGASIAVLTSCEPAEFKQVRMMTIDTIDLSNVPDGTYTGEFTYWKYTSTAKTTVRNHRITTLEISENRDNKYVEKARGVIPLIIERQTPSVDTISGATTSSKAFQKAVEYSLHGAITQTTPPVRENSGDTQSR